ncbi:MAG: hypothetical protein A3K18_30315 [Lentisphaerae bacterium RIFOXYA12_64_32]|nr:MAG: hypothetical protein A3K18_30315 [Lentisphaerae bacterium RIFOXYA12_64_32]
MDPVLDIIERSNQRGGRMLSVVDLVEARTLSLGQAAWLMDRVAEGASWLVGAKPGGAGKTTVMSALLGVMPPPPKIWLTNTGAGWAQATAGDCVVCYEVSPGHYDAYIWGKDVQRLMALGNRGVRIVSNLHADTLDQARAQVVDDCGANATEFAAFGLFLPIVMTGGGGSRQREVNEAQQVRDGEWGTVSRVDAEVAARADTVAFLERACADKLQTVEGVRRAWLAHCGRSADAR